MTIEIIVQIESESSPVVRKTIYWKLKWWQPLTLVLDQVQKNEKALAPAGTKRIHITAFVVRAVEL